MVLKEVQEQGMDDRKRNYSMNTKELKNIKTIQVTPVTRINSNKKNVVQQRKGMQVCFPMVLLDYYGNMLSNMLCFLFIGWKNYCKNMFLMEQ